MSSKNIHQECSPCPLASALDVIGDHWSLLIIRDLMFMDRHEYKDMLGSWEGISTNILSNRLEKLTSYGLVSSTPHPDSNRRKLYYLTNKGKSLFPVMAEITLWGLSQKEPKKIPPHLQRLVSEPRDKIEKIINEKLEQWEKTYV